MDAKEKKQPSTKEPAKTKKPILQQNIGDIVSNVITDKLLKIPDKPHAEKIAKLSGEQLLQLQVIEENAIAKFSGQLDELESALGMLRMGHHFGWRVLYLIHSKRTIRKYEDILGIKIRDVFPDKGPSSYRSAGLCFAEKFSNFWKVVGGDIKIPDRKKIE